MKVFVVTSTGKQVSKTQTFDMDTDEGAMEKALRTADYLVDDIKQGKSNVDMIALVQSVGNGQSNLMRYYVPKRDEWVYPRRSIYDGMAPGEEATFYM
jgi:hypothetical protein